MIKTENITIGGRQFVRTWSDEGRYVRGGEPESDYYEAIDPAELGRTYIEGDIIDDPVNSDEILNIILGGTE